MITSHSLRVGDHVSLHKHYSNHLTYGTIIGLIDNDGGEFVQVLIEGEDKSMSIPASMVYLYARAGATK